MGLDFNDSTAIFAPKGARAGDMLEVIREADATRPLSLKNSANKTICRAMAASLHPHLPEAIHGCQRGFVPGRDLVRNVIDLDTAARVSSLRADDLRNMARLPPLQCAMAPVLVFLDLVAAFPSLAHDAIFATLRHLGALSLIHI